MILKKIKVILNDFRSKLENLRQQNLHLANQNEQIRLQNSELEWANIYHDTIRDKAWLRNIAISPGRWAVNYSFLYILVRILSDHKPHKIIEFGLGESSKIVSAFLETELPDSSHLIIEQDKNWIESFRSRFNLSKNSSIIHLPLEEKIVKGFAVASYNAIEERIDGVFDLYIIDGPFGSDNYSRYDICKLVEKIKMNDEFIIIIDDYDRPGEKETVIDLKKYLEAKRIKFYEGVYSGNKSQIIIATEKYRFIRSL